MQTHRTGQPMGAKSHAQRLNGMRVHCGALEYVGDIFLHVLHRFAIGKSKVILHSILVAVGWCRWSLCFYFFIFLSFYRLNWMRGGCFYGFPLFFRCLSRQRKSGTPHGEHEFEIKTFLTEQKRILCPWTLWFPEWCRTARTFSVVFLLSMHRIVHRSRHHNTRCSLLGYFDYRLHQRSMVSN